VDHHRLRSQRDRPRLHAGTGRPIELAGEERFDRAKQRDADECHDFRPVAAYFSLQELPASDIFSGREIVDSGARPRNQVRDAEPELRQPRIVHIRNRLRHETRFGQQLPEAIRKAGEVVTCLCRPHTGVDPDKQHAHARLDAIFQTKINRHSKLDTASRQSKIFNRQCNMPP